MARAGWWVLMVALVLACVGCDRDADESATSYTPAPELTWRPLEVADPGVQGTPAPPAKRADLKLAGAARAGGRDRIAAESFAVQVAQVLADVRDGVPGNQILARIASADLPESVRRYLVHDIDTMHESELQRYLDPSAGIWIRSRLVGPVDEPFRVETEIAAVLVSEPMRFREWHRDRYDVAWEDGKWSLVGYSGGGFGPSTSPLTPAERREFLPGPGWRFVPPA